MTDAFAIELLPEHSLTITTLPISNGGLGFQHPRAAAIPSFVFTVKQSINYALHGIHLPHQPSATILPTSITNLYDEWNNNSTSKTFTTFTRYAPQLASICHDDGNTPPPSLPPKVIDKFISSPSTSFHRDVINYFAGTLAIDALYTSAHVSVLHALPSLLNPLSSYPLIAMSRIESKHRMDNQTFTTAVLQNYASPSSDQPMPQHASLGRRSTATSITSSNAVTSKKPQ